MRQPLCSTAPQACAEAGFRKMYRPGFKPLAMGYYAQAAPGKS
jgi:hypothetical protein